MRTRGLDVGGTVDGRYVNARSVRVTPSNAHFEQVGSGASDAIPRPLGRSLVRRLGHRRGWDMLRRPNAALICILAACAGCGSSTPGEAPRDAGLSSEAATVEDAGTTPET